MDNREISQPRKKSPCPLPFESLCPSNAETNLQGQGDSFRGLEHCALCGQPVPDPKYRWEGPKPIGGESEKSWLCESCGEKQEGRESLAQATDWALDRIIGRKPYPSPQTDGPRSGPSKISMDRV